MIIQTRVSKYIPLLVLSAALFAAADLRPMDLFTNLDLSMKKIYPAAITICWILGYFLLAKAVFMLKKLGHKTAFMGSSGNLMGPVAVILIAVILINAPTFIKVVVMSLYANDVQSTKQWASRSGQYSWFSALKPMIGLIQVIGIFAFLRGCLILTKACNENAQPGNIPKGLMHIFGGILAINITGTIDLIDSSLGIR
jgi:intracellular multiplication protein IcmC